MTTPTSDELAEIYGPTDHCSPNGVDLNYESFSDDLAALHEAAIDSRREKTENNAVIHHRIWRVDEVFRSEPREPPTSPAMEVPHMPSSPPLTPSSSQQKRKAEPLDLGNSILGRLSSSQQKRKAEPLDLGNSILERPVKVAKAQREYYGIDIHKLLEEAQAEERIAKATADIPTPPSEPQQQSKKANLLWTEKYRARKFTDLIGDERTHRSVMHWLKRWDQIVFPGTARPKQKAKGPSDQFEEKPHRKILMLTGPPGLGKTTLAHVCAKQAGYEVQEINASDERSSQVVKGRIKDMVGTENVKGQDTKTATGKVRKAGKPVCVIIDEVDGVVGGSGGGGEGGFVKALIDLVMLDQKNSALSSLQQAPAKKRKGDRFRLLRPLILVCNDVYHPSLRPLRQSSFAEIIHMRKPPIQTITSRMQSIFEREGIPCEGDGVRRLCEATWGVTSRKEDRGGSGAGEGDMRGIMVVGEWVAGKLRTENQRTGNARLTRRWVEDNLLQDLQHGGGAARGVGRGGPKEIVERVFQEGAGFPKSSVTVTPLQQAGVSGVAEGGKRNATDRLRNLIDTYGDTDRIVTDIYSSYPERSFQDDTYLTKPNAAYEWLHFHDRLSSAVYASNEWELAPYLSTPVVAFHHLFASPTRAQYATVPVDENALTEDAAPLPFTGPQASWHAHEATKHNASLLQTLQSSLSADLTRLFTSPSSIATDLLPHLHRMLSPNINPILVGGSSSEKSTASVRKSSEQALVQRSVTAMFASGVRFERHRVNATEDAGAQPQQSWNATQWIYRMTPSLDSLAAFETGGKGFGEAGAKQRYAVRQVLEQEYVKEERKRAEAARLARVSGVVNLADSGVGKTKGAVKGDELPPLKIKRDFFGRPVVEEVRGPTSREGEEDKKEGKGRVWVHYSEGFSNAVRKPITLAELMKGM